VSQTPHVETLVRRHAAFEADIAEELKRPAPDADRIRDLKREKLRLKDAIAIKSKAHA
jgi:hypothetical protein